MAGAARGGDLMAHDAWLETCFSRSEELLDVPRLRRLWNCLRDLPRAPAISRMGRTTLERILADSRTMNE